MSTRSHYLVGLTGGIGCGKSTVANGFAANKVSIIDADVLAHRLSAPGGAAIDALRRAFGVEYITKTGALDRARMRRLVFDDDQARGTLEAILHPLIRKETEREIAQSTSAYTILVIPLLFESKNWQERIDRALVVDCSEEDQVQRVMQRSNLTREEVAAIMSRQIDRASRRQLADDIIENSGPPAALKPAIEALHRRYLDLAGARRL